MTINIANNSPRINYTATANQTVFTVPFDFFDNTDIKVYVEGTLKTITTDYQLSGGNGSTGTVTFVTGVTLDNKVTLVRDVPMERTTDLTSNYSPQSIDGQLDRIVAEIADLDDRVSRSVQINDYELATNLVIPEIDNRKGRALQFNASNGDLEAGFIINDKLDISGGTMTGNLTVPNIIVSGVVDGVDISARDSVLTSTTTTANAALPKAGGTMTGDLDFDDGIKANFGDSNDLQIFHSLGNSFVQDAGEGDLFIAGSNAVRIVNSNASETYATFNLNSGVDLYHDNTLRFQTSSTGISVAGNVFVTGTVDGRDILVDGTKLDTIESNADVTDTANVVASLTAGTNITIASDGTIASVGSSYTDSDAISAVTGADLDMGGNKVLFSNMYATLGDLPSATDNHGMFAHVHATGKGYFAHSGNWVALANASDVTSYTHPNHSGEVTSTSDGATVIADNVVDEANLKVSNTPTNGYVLTAQSGNTGGLTWAAASGGGSSTLDGLSDVSTSGVTSGQVLKYNGTNWTPASDNTASAGGGITTGKSIAMAMVFG